MDITARFLPVADGLINRTFPTPIIDCAPEDAAALKQRLQRRGYSVLAVAL